MLFRQLFDPETSTYTYLLADEQSREAVLIDSVIEQVERDAQLLTELGLTLVWAIDTHVHADHVTGMGALKDRFGCQTVLSERAGTGWADRLVKQGDLIRFGSRHLEVRETPGHTDGCVSYVTDDRAMVFTGDALLIRGCGRTDFQQGDAATLFDSLREQVFSLSDETMVYPGHDYKGRTASTVGEERRWNPRLGGGRSREGFAEIMAKLQLAYPKKIDVALPMNLRCGVPRDLPASGEDLSHDRWAPVVVSASGVPEVSCDWLAAHTDAGRIVDVREAEEFVGELGHVEGSSLVPLSTVATAAEAWDREAPVVLVCRSGGRSGKAALALREKGFSKVVSMRGGMTAWNALRLPVAR